MKRVQRWATVVAGSLWLVAAVAPLWAGEATKLKATKERFPYVGIVTGDKVSVRSGPSANHYRTGPASVEAVM